MLPENKITIGFLSPKSLEDKRFLSGTFYTMAKALESTGRVVWIPVKSSSIWYRLYLKFVKEANRFLPFLKSKLPKLQMWKRRITARSINYGLIEKCDVLFAPMQSGALSAIKPVKPVIYLSDATYHVMIDYYWFDLPKKDIEECEFIEKTAMDNASALVYPSHWAAESAVRDYGQPREKITFARFGPNIDVNAIVPHVFTFDGHLDILFVGVDWKRKGGLIAVEACKWLNDNGIDSTLHVAGIKSLDPRIASLPFVENHGFLNKNNLEDYSKLMALYDRADCFLLPTLAECAGICFCEASAYGLPSFTHDTGGVCDYVFEGETGFLLSLGSTGEDFGRVIKECLEDGRMETMSKASPEVARERFSWKVWAERMEEVIDRVL